MAFVRYTKKGRSFTPKISISAAGMISFNSAARKQFDLEKYDLCVLFYDPDARLVGVKPTNDKKEEGARKLRMRVSTGADVSARSFLNYFQIDFSKTTTYDASIDKDGLIVFNLNKGTVRTAHRRKKKA